MVFHFYFFPIRVGLVTCFFFFLENTTDKTNQVTAQSVKVSSEFSSRSWADRLCLASIDGWIVFFRLRGCKISTHISRFRRRFWLHQHIRFFGRVGLLFLWMGIFVELLCFFHIHIRVSGILIACFCLLNPNVLRAKKTKYMILSPIVLDVTHTLPMPI